MRLGIIGGALQGMECALLARDAGYRSIVIDRRPNAPALSLCDEPLVMDPAADPEGAASVFEELDYIIPACEDTGLLDALVSILGDDPRFLFDPGAYAVSRSKLESNRLMSGLGVPMPAEWPECGYPVVVKPSSLSGSVGVTVANDRKEMDEGISRVYSLGDEPVVQGFARGRSVSVEVIGDGGDAVPYITTEVCLDPGYDCKMVRCHPGILSGDDEVEFGRIGARIARELGLRGIMDVEAILTDRGLRVLEVDARMPSQTPAAVLAASGVNLLREMVHSAQGSLHGPGPMAASSVYRHFVYSDGVLRSCGEKEFSKVRSPRFRRGLFGSDLAITDFEPGSDEWRATLIISAPTEEAVDERSAAAMEMMKDECSTDVLVDEGPEVV